MHISSVNTSKGELRYAECCGGPRNLIVLPGVSVSSVLDSAAAVETVYSVFNGKYTLYLIEYPNEYPEEAEIDYIADIIAEAIGLLGLKNNCLFGASFGGMVGQVLLAEHPELFVSAAFGSSVAKLAEEYPKTIARWHTIALSGDIRTLNLAFYDAVYSDAYQIRYAEAIRNVLENGTETNCRVMAVHTGMMLRADLSAYARKIKTPTLMIGAEVDHVFSPKDVAEAARLMGGKLFLYEGSSHAVFDEEPDFQQRLLAYFEESEH